MPDLALQWRTFLVPKDGHAADECEDAIAGDPDVGRFAIADGASESYAAGEWAHLLVAAYVTSGPSRNWLTEPRKAWQQAAAGLAVTWYAEEKFSLGGHATFLGLTFQRFDDRTEWEATAVGDACLFHLVAGACLTSFPVERASGFNSAPTLIGSRGGSPPWKITNGVLLPGEVLLLATDALAQGLLKSMEEKAFVGRDLLDMDDDDFSLWVMASRAAGRLKNDDVALGIVEVVDHSAS